MPATIAYIKNNGNTSHNCLIFQPPPSSSNFLCSPHQHKHNKILLMLTRSEIRSIFYKENSETKKMAHPALAAPATSLPSLLQHHHFPELFAPGRKCFRKMLTSSIHELGSTSCMGANKASAPGLTTVQSLLAPDQRCSRRR